MEKQFDVICMGRVAVDLYSQQIGARLEDVSSFAKYLGGSSGNVAYGTARQGLRSSMLARVGDEHMGRFLREELNQVGCDTSHLITDKERLTALVLLGIKDRDTFPLIFYRDNCADMAITASDVDESYIASARCLAITGTHLSHPQTREAVLTALGYARRHGVRTVLDIDYRPVLWGLTSLGDGETRFIAADQVTRELQEVLHLFDVIVGTEEEFHIAGGSTDTLQALGRVRTVSEAALACKRGRARLLGLYRRHSVPAGRRPDGDRRARGGAERSRGGGRVYVRPAARLPERRGLGAGVPLRQRLRRAGGLAPRLRPGDAEQIELDDYLSRAAVVPRPDLDPRLNHLHRVTTRRREWPELCVMAFVTAASLRIWRCSAVRRLSAFRR